MIIYSVRTLKSVELATDEQDSEMKCLMKYYIVFILWIDILKMKRT